ncbi:MFS transporter [Dactylosporangium sp. AC04546]|uniref:MFS transporter n=1 Tax=Dactylosporangium sp. AC04546 TaxID=2862460 RepID=UPI001EDE1D37|nr:MFS transporter [Dactylosporangium sp. AC04546]WVK86489.1 MFS transporter [Dactylosporangium sp. AC04546]
MTGSDGQPLASTLAERGFRRLLGVRIASQFGDGMFQAALAGSVLFNPERQTTAVAVAAGTAVLLLPYSLLGPFAGVLLDVWSRRRVLVAASIARIVLVGLAALLIAVASQGLLFMLVVLVAIGLNRLFLSAVSAATPHVVADARLVTANAVSGTAGSLASSAGIGCALLALQTAVSIGYHGYATVAALAPLGYAASAALAVRRFGADDLGPDRVPRRQGAWARVTGVARDLGDGVRHLVRRRNAALALTVQTGFRMLFGVLTLALLLLHRNYFPGDDDIAGSVTALAGVFVAGALGVIVGAALTPRLTHRIGGQRWITAVLVAAAMALAGFGLPFRSDLLLVVVFVLNIAAQSIKIVTDTFIQQECDDAYRGRVFSVSDTTFNLAYVVGMFAAAFVLPDTGRSPVVLLLVAAALLATAAAYAARRWRAQAAWDAVADASRT